MTTRWRSCSPTRISTPWRRRYLHPVDSPKVDVEPIEKGQDVKFSCEVFVYPEIKLGDYKGVDITRTLHTVTKEELDARLKQEQKQMARSIEITDRAV